MTEFKLDASQEALLKVLFQEESQHLMAFAVSEEMLSKDVGSVEEILAEQVRGVCKRVHERYLRIVQVQTKVEAQ
jgi:hypothetical protein